MESQGDARSRSALGRKDLGEEDQQSCFGQGGQDHRQSLGSGGGAERQPVHGNAEEKATPPSSSLTVHNRCRRLASWAAGAIRTGVG